MTRQTCRYVLFIALVALAGGIVHAASQSDDTIVLAPNPSWCHTGHRCLTMEEYGQMTLIKVRLEDERDALRLRIKQRQVLGGRVAPFILSGVLFDAGDSTRSPFVFGGVRVWKLGLQGGVYSRNGEARFGGELTFYHEW